MLRGMPCACAECLQSLAVLVLIYLLQMLTDKGKREVSVQDIVAGTASALDEGIPMFVKRQESGCACRSMTAFHWEGNGQVFKPKKEKAT